MIKIFTQLRIQTQISHYQLSTIFFQLNTM
jgi:hypothetical protein